MHSAIKPSRVAVRDAWQMGSAFAKNDPRLVPVIEAAHQYASYAQFIAAHRLKMSHSAVFAPWEARLQKVIDAEAKRNGLKPENPVHWERIENLLAVPLRCAFWFGWEQEHKVQTLYDRHVSNRRRLEQMSTICIALAAPEGPIIERLPDHGSGTGVMALLTDLPQSTPMFHRAAGVDNVSGNPSSAHADVETVTSAGDLQSQTGGQSGPT